ncbi:thiosulfate oxidation carrier protein SoxY [bacterium]|nr:MAG: thiosulfate oxidation carrier protein SoxY [bacterium]
MPDSDPHIPATTRRQFVLATGGGLLAAALAGLFPTAAAADATDVEKWLAAFSPAKPTPGKITIGAPDIAENGNVVPITLTVDSPMTAQSYVKGIAMAAEGNPLPAVTVIELSPANAKAEVQFRMRLAKTQTVTAVALMSDNTLWSATKTIKVTIGGCGG